LPIPMRTNALFAESASGYIPLGSERVAAISRSEGYFAGEFIPGIESMFIPGIAE
jgi:hypothetical protein